MNAQGAVLLFFGLCCLYSAAWQLTYSGIGAAVLVLGGIVLVLGTVRRVKLDDGAEP